MQQYFRRRTVTKFKKNILLANSINKFRANNSKKNKNHRPLSKSKKWTGTTIKKTFQHHIISYIHNLQDSIIIPFHWAFGVGAPAVASQTICTLHHFFAVFAQVAAVVSQTHLLTITTLGFQILGDSRNWPKQVETRARIWSACVFSFTIIASQLKVICHGISHLQS